MPFVHLQVTSSYDLLSSTITLSALIERAKKEGYRSIAITDRNVLYGVVPFYRACIKENIKPIIGMTADVWVEQDERSYPLVLLAENETGFKNLIKISSGLQTKSPKGIPQKWLSSYSSGLIALTPGNAGEIEQLVHQQSIEEAMARTHQYREMFGEESFYISIQNHGLLQDQDQMEALHSFASSAGIPTAASCDVRYLEKEDSFSYEVITAIRDGIKIEGDRLEGDYSFLSKEEIKEKFSSYPETMEATLEISQRCQVELDFTRTYLPKYPVPDDVTAKEVLEHLCMEGMKKRISAISPLYKERLLYELSVIDRMSFNDYFLIVWDFMKFAREQGILTGPGRGSAAGSLVAYALYITHVDPIKHDLLFERFLNPERISMPDIDIDFPDHRRDEVIQYVAEKYGSKHVAQIVTFGSLSAKAIARDTARVYGFSTGEMEVISRSIPSRPGIVLEEAYKESPNLRQFVDQSSRHQQWFNTAKKLEGLPRHTSTHAAGVVISDRPLVDIVPLQQGQEYIHLTQWPMDILEDVGLLKMDFLGLRNLTLLEKITQAVKSQHPQFRLEDIPGDDRETFDLLSKGLTVGIFQLESDGMKNVLTKLKPSKFEDIVAVNALYRPGPMEHIPLFIKRKHKIETVQYAHEDLKDILSPTHGIIVYQEQIMQIAARLAGFTLGQADMLRRAVSKKKKEDLDRERARFVQGSIKRGYGEKTGNEIYDLIVQFANYGFNKSHAVAYSLIAYQLAYLKAHYAKHFMAALMTSVTGNEDKMRLYIRECERLNIPVLPPSINKSQRYFAVEEEGIRYSISSIKGIGKTPAMDIVTVRRSKEYKDLFDLCVRVPSKSINRKVIEALVFSGALDDFGKDRSTLLATIDVALEHASLMASDDGGLFGDDFNISPKYIEKSPMPPEEKLAYEKEVLGLYLSAHPVSAMKDKLATLQAKSSDELQPGQRSIIMGALVTDIRMIRTKKGEAMAFAVLSDAAGDIDAVVFPDVYRHASSILIPGSLIILQGKAEERNGRVQIVIQEIKLAKDWNTPKSSPKLFLRIPQHLDQEGTLEQVREICSKYKGGTPVVIHFEDSKRTIQLQRSEWGNISGDLSSELKKLLGNSNVVVQ
ncbi:DNA polymerase III subunit alpha [Jeotgalibacillus sp. S-D1]|uniref:DNA polymerase III subunit alpha n=1 Tax=Jeotgalibacillus sp. S-D1 TaxID=2552189 RepID=UPI001059A161|nr:DNA polymerase III subunit alpha [Jeotgalibacillus sp. S-D1]TDL34326.1 DNA polymerase III subunit alpha [Jeotgalibacillus sp. S-D1]